MARLLYARQSTEVHLNSARRHMRLCRKINGTEVLIKQIEPPIAELEQRQSITRQKSIDRDTAYDNLAFTDSMLDDSIRTTFEHVKQFDRENPGRPILLQLFPDGKFSGIVQASFEKEADLAEVLVVRLQALGADHTLNARVETLQQAIQKCRTAHASYMNAITIQKSAKAEEDIAQAALRKQYELNYYDASRLFGKNMADRLFPQLSKSVSDDENTPPALSEATSLGQ